MKLSVRILSLLAGLSLAACGGGRVAQAPSSETGQVATGGGYYKVGRPYKIKGNWYYPKEDYSYDESGIASWYGADFHNQLTANGEVYNKNELTAAHKTLPMPSLARVTNLENGRSIVVRINDRGPFSGARIIDVSQRSSQLLGFERQGTAKVRVQVLADESKAIADAMRTYGGPSQQAPQMDPYPKEPEPQIASVEEVPLDNTVYTQPASQPLPPMQSVHPVAEYVQLPVTGANQIYVQAGAFTNLTNAQRLTTNLQKVGTTRIAQAVVKGVQYYRVRVGPVATVADADKLLKRVMRSGADNARIIVD
ncbi:MAG: septal ring lytic transglycosylase RlpA family protein [Bdellovibrionales bacterium]